MKNNIIIEFLSEIVIRLSKKSPLFFKILQYISIAVAIIPGIPALLESFGVTLPAFLADLSNQTIAICGIVAAFLTGLPVDKAPVPVEPKLTLKGEIPMGIALDGKQLVTEKIISLPFTDNNGQSNTK